MSRDRLKRGRQIGGSPKGFTILELVVSLSLFLIVLTAIYMVYATSSNTYTWGEERTDNQQNARIALAVMERELRQVGYDPSSAIASGNPYILVGAATQVEFVGDVDMNGTSDKVRYTYVAASKTITREVSTWTGGSFPAYASPVPVFAEGITGLTLAYYDSAAAQLAVPLSASDLLNAKMISITVTASGTQMSYTIQTNVRPRNL